MVAGIGSFKAAFAEKVKKTEKENVSKPPDKRVKSRAASKCSGEVEAIWGSFCSKLRFSVAIPECTSAAPQFLGVQAGAVACGAEPDGLASWRLVLEGTRTVVAAPVAACCRNG